MSNKQKPRIKFGLKNVHYALMSEEIGGNVTYATPIMIPGAVNLSMSPKGDESPFFADDIEYFNAIANQGYDGTLELALVGSDFEKDILGEVLDIKNVQFEKSKVIGKKFALLFEFTSDVNGIRHVMYNVTASRPNIEGATKTASIEAKTETLNIKARPVPNTDNVKSKTTIQTEQSIYDGWYRSVYIETTEVQSDI